MRVSIHAPAWGATMGFVVKASGVLVSIHAPAWGATRVLLQLHWVLRRFNPRARVGRDAKRAGLVSKDSWFQSTRPRGARRNGLVSRSDTRMFQSTRPRGARLVCHSE